MTLDRMFLAPHGVARWATETPDQVALQHTDGRALSYRELHETTMRWATALTRIGVEHTTHMATMIPNDFAAHLAMLSCGWLRAIEVPLNTAYVGQMLEHALELSDATYLLTTSEFWPRIDAVLPNLALLKTIVVLDGPAPAPSVSGVRVIGAEEFLRDAAPAEGLAGPEVWDIAALLFTSGTTGPSKAVISPWGFVYQIWSWGPEDTLRQGEALYDPMPLFHNSGRAGFNLCMVLGATFVFRDRFSGTSMWDDVRRYNCSVAALVGPMTSVIWSAPLRPDDADNPLRAIVLGPMIPEMEAFEKRFDVKVCTCYGQTEVGAPVVTGWDHGPVANCGRKRDSWPYPQVMLADEHDNPVPVGEPGEMLVRAEPWSLNLGYYKMPEASMQAWRNGWFHTGDAFRQDEDGYYYFVDRMKDAIRRRGENISSFEVENAVTQYPAVLECAALGIKTPYGDDEVMAAVRVSDPADFKPEDLLEFLAPRMPKFMLPRYVEVFDDFPRNSTTNRVRKNELRERGVGPATWDREAVS
jgi:crotonobetaine/carnitine-CoA ligase